MIKVENVDVFGFEGAIRGMRNPKNSWHLSDSKNCNDCYQACEDIDADGNNLCTNCCSYRVGKADLNLMQRLIQAGTEHRKFLRMIHVQMDITCHQFFWLEFDTYKVGVTKNSCSKMHKIHVKSFERDDFSHEGIDEVGGRAVEQFEKTLETLEWLRVQFNETHEKKYWRAMVELLPSGFNLKSYSRFQL